MGARTRGRTEGTQPSFIQPRTGTGSGGRRRDQEPSTPHDDGRSSPVHPPCVSPVGHPTPLPSLSPSSPLPSSSGGEETTSDASAAAQLDSLNRKKFDGKRSRFPATCDEKVDLVFSVSKGERFPTDVPGLVCCHCSNPSVGAVPSLVVMCAPDGIDPAELNSRSPKPSELHQPRFGHVPISNSRKVLSIYGPNSLNTPPISGRQFSLRG